MVLLDDNLVSKTNKKKQMDKLQDLGMSLTKLTKDQLLKMNLSDILLDAILMYKSLNSNKAQKRQAQYIGRVMRDEDGDVIQNKLDEILGDSVFSTKLLHLTEYWRDKLIELDSELHIFLDKYNNIEIDITLIRQLIRLSRLEILLARKPNTKKLFQLIKHIISAE